MEKKFIITTDSSCDLGPEKVKKHDVDFVNLTYTIDDEVFYDDMVDENLDKFYAKMEAGAEPKTSMVPPMDFVDFFSEKLPSDLPILHVSIGSALSGTYQSAVNAIEMVISEHPEADIRIVDSTVASGGLALMVMEAVKYRDKGRTIEETMARLNAIKEHINTYITTDDLTYLCRGGRVSKVGAVLGKFMSINPIITLSKGSKLYVTTKVRGGNGAIEKLSTLVGETVLKPEKQTVYIMHSNALARAKLLGRMLQDKYGFRKVEYLKFGTTIGSHAGPGLICAFYFGKVRTHRAVR